MRLARVAIALAAVASVSATSACKTHKPAARLRIWLGVSHACSVQATSRVLECWGRGDAGQLGDGAAASRALPTVVSGLVDGAVDGVALGARHTCALSGGAVRCWGEGTRGQLGTGRSVTLGEPSASVVAGDAALSRVSAIAARGDRTCALTPDGARCWGDGALRAEELPGLRGAASALAVGGDFACATFTEPRAVRCSGADERGQSGGRAPLAVGATVLGITAGDQHACVVLDTGAVECWGANDHGQLGDGTTNDARAPSRVAGLPPAVEVRAGAAHTCARLRNNTVACWGDNRAHQLVRGDTLPSATPAAVQGLIGVVELAAGGDSACARLAGGEVRCWGANAAGQLGDGTTAPHAVPMPVKGPVVATGERR